MQTYNQSKIIQYYKNILLKHGLAGFGNVLDAGCGDGLFSLALSTANKNVYAIDIKNMLDLSVEGIKNINFSVGCVEKLPFKDNSFEIVVANSVVQYITDQKAAISEIGRVLKGNGFVLMLYNHNRAYYLNRFVRLRSARIRLYNLYIFLVSMLPLRHIVRNIERPVSYNGLRCCFKKYNIRTKVIATPTYYPSFHGFNALKEFNKTGLNGYFSLLGHKEAL